MSNNRFASGVHIFSLTNLDVRFHFNSATFFLSFLAGSSSISKTSPSIWTVASCVRSWWLSSLLSGTASSVSYSVSESSKRVSVSLSVSLLISHALQIYHGFTFHDLYVFTFFCYFFPWQYFCKTVWFLHMHSLNFKKSFSLLSLFTYTHYGRYVLF